MEGKIRTTFPFAWCPVHQNSNEASKKLGTMKNIVKEEQWVDTVRSITCDCCKIEYDDIMEIQEFLQYANDAGYGSIMGDGNRLRLDLCQHCVKKLLGDFIRTEGSYIWNGISEEKIATATMDPKHNHLNDELLKHSSFKDDKPE